MIPVICAACSDFLGYICSSDDPYEATRDLAIEHKAECDATPEEYERALTDMKFKQIVKGLGL